MKDTISKTVVTDTGRKEAGKADVITGNVKEDTKKTVVSASSKENTKKSVDTASSKEDTKKTIDSSSSKEDTKKPVVSASSKEDTKKSVGTASSKEDTKKSVDTASSKKEAKKSVDTASSKEDTKKPIDTASKGLIDTIKQKKDNDLEKKRQHTREYMKKQDFVYLRLPSKNEELGIPDYKQMVKDYAAGKGVSVNALLTALVEKELKIKITSLAFIRENMKSEARQDIINK